MSVLESIIAGVKEDLALRKENNPLGTIQNQAAHAEPAMDVVDKIRQNPNLSLICEVKRKSPSKGELAEIKDPAKLAKEYELGSATAISVLTEQRRFKGSLTDLAAVRAKVSLPLLRKDFIVDEYQIYEARAYGADIILLIVAALTDEQLSNFFDLTRALGMRALIETHTEAEIARALAIDAQLIGVNARDLKTLDVNRVKAENLLRLIPKDRLAIAESAVEGINDIEAYAAAGADAVLIGEALVKHPDPRQGVSDFSSIPRSNRH